MNNEELSKKITSEEHRLDEAVSLKARLKHTPLKTLWFYLLVFLNRYGLFLIPIRTKTIWGAPLEAYESSAIGSVYFLGFYDSDMTQFLLRHDFGGGDFLDIGSNIGYYALLFDRIAAPGAKVIAVEPTPSTFKTLTKNVASSPRIQPFPFAISDTNGTIPFIDYGYRYAVFNSTKNHELPFLQGVGHKLDVKSITLDAFCAEYNLHPALIKLDTEGTESIILKTGRETLTKNAPVILLEVGGGEEWKENNASCLDTLESYHYRFFESDVHGTLTPHIRKDVYLYQNLVCIPEHKIAHYARAH